MLHDLDFDYQKLTTKEYYSVEVGNYILELNSIIQ